MQSKLLEKYNKEKSMQIISTVPDYVDTGKLLRWEEQSQPVEGMVLVETMKQECLAKGINWLLFYCWCYVSTQAFRNPCLKNWDVANIGGNFSTFRAGVKEACGEILRFENTAMLAQQKEIESLYETIDLFCKGVVWTDPKPPVEPPKPPTQPGEPQQPEEPKKSTNILGWLKVAVPVLLVIGFVAKMFLPGSVGAIIDMVLKVLSAIAGLS
jgi:hypothetical protein